MGLSGEPRGGGEGCRLTVARARSCLPSRLGQLLGQRRRDHGAPSRGRDGLSGQVAGIYPRNGGAAALLGPARLWIVHRPEISSPVPAACRPNQESCRGHRRARLIAPRGSAGPACPAGGVAMTAAFLGRESLDFLVARLSWPVPFVRWRAARAPRDLVDAPATRTGATGHLLTCLASARCEHEVRQIGRGSGRERGGQYVWIAVVPVTYK